MKKVALLLLASTLTFGAIAQKKDKKEKAPVADTLDVSKVQVIKVGSKYYSVEYLDKLSVLYLNNPEQALVIFNILSNSIQSQYPASVLDHIRTIIQQQIPQQKTQ